MEVSNVVAKLKNARTASGARQQGFRVRVRVGATTGSARVHTAWASAYALDRWGLFCCLSSDGECFSAAPFLLFDPSLSLSLSLFTCSSLCSGGKMVVRKCHVPSFWPNPLPGVVAMPARPPHETKKSTAAAAKRARAGCTHACRHGQTKTQDALLIPAAPTSLLFFQGHTRAVLVSGRVCGQREKGERERVPAVQAYMQTHPHLPVASSRARQ